MNEFDENKIATEGDNAPAVEAQPETQTVQAPASVEMTDQPPVSESAPLGEAASTDDASQTGEGEPTAPTGEMIPPYVPVYTPPQPSKRKHNTGLIVFAIIVAVVMIAGAALAGAYALIGGVNDVLSDLPVEDLAPEYETELQDRPGKTLEEGTPSYVYQQTVDSVVFVQVYSLIDSAVGNEASGVIYSDDGYIITNDHIYRDIPDPQFLITTADGRQFDATFVAGDSRTDLSVLKVKDANDLTPAVLGDSTQCVVGEQIITIGNPGGSAFTFSMTDGTISAVDRWARNSSNYPMRFIQIDAPINSGNSGGALVNMYGQVIGITSWKYNVENFENMAFAIPSETVVRICDSLISYGYVADRAKLGITYTAIDTVTAKLSGLSSTGLLIAEITPGTSIADSGAQVGDLITHINGEKIVESTDMLAVLENCLPGEQVTLTLIDSNGQTHTVQVELLEDRGSSSYTLEASDDTQSSANGGEFDFPEGE